MATVSLIWQGDRPRRTGSAPRSMPFDSCVTELGLRQYHYVGPEMPTVKSDKPRLDDYRAAWGLIIHLKVEEVDSGWKAGWYAIPFAPGRIPKIQRVLERHPRALDS